MDLHTTQAAAELLSKEIGETVDYWITRLANIRNPKRANTYRLSFATTVGRAGLYAEEDLRTFIEFEKTRRIGDMKLSSRAAEALRAFGVGQPGGSTTGRKLNYTATLQPSNEGMSGPFAQLLIKDPLLVFRLDREELGALVKDLAEIKTRLDSFYTQQAYK